eukprot:CAMPEP_0201536162 /NCGR_PEP_ID=MMETSP0161_2-20130828/61120_1 /ASSEMBLY_ACC=CAM_ASM_000251 /TAXON_ID=180227 /ORGANISM="Neoparamoeba aestuarina, Strain SoJaBio B1-5/56/2" /LENGTH=311 /DNA_ID=CAMNT_0047941705 /DNA_START=47 /DNA_END=982 /DNA_ORIENTATION=-
MKWKERLIELQYNLDKPPVRELPPLGSPVPPLHQKVAVDGHFDYTGSFLVGPRACPDLKDGKSGSPGQMMSTTGSKKWGASQGGFYVFTPFHVASDESLLLVNIGWVPIDACRSDTHLRKYLRKTTSATQTLKGSVKYEEDFRTWWNGYTEACHQKLGVSWPVIRPAEMIKDYLQSFKQWKKGTANEVMKTVDDDLFLNTERITPRAPLETSEPPTEDAEDYPYRHYYVRMFDEDDTARVIIDGEIFPKRSSEHFRETFFVTPNTHLQYAVFWFFASAMSARFLKKTMDRAATIAVKRAAEAKVAAQVANK